MIKWGNDVTPEIAGLLQIINDDNGYVRFASSRSTIEKDGKPGRDTEKSTKKDSCDECRVTTKNDKRMVNVY